MSNLHVLVGREYGRADARWVNFDSCLISIELATVFAVGPMCVWMMYAIASRAPYRHFLQIVVSVCELYGGTVYIYVKCAS